MNTSDQETTAQSQVRFDQMPALAIKVITNPVGFYQDMAKSAGLLDPLAFMIVLSVASGLITAATSLFGFGAAGAMATGLFAIILVPIFVVIFGFIAAAIASIHVHRRGTQLSWAVCGALGLVLALFNVAGERAARQMQDSMADWQSILEERRNPLI